MQTSEAQRCGANLRECPGIAMAKVLPQIASGAPAAPAVRQR